MQHREKIHVSWLLAVFAGGFIGGILRYVISGVTHDGTTMMGTTIVNLIGSFLLAFTTYGLDMKFDLPNGCCLPSEQVSSVVSRHSPRSCWTLRPWHQGMRFMPHYC